MKHVRCGLKVVCLNALRQKLQISTNTGQLMTGIWSFWGNSYSRENKTRTNYSHHRAHLNSLINHPIFKQTVQFINNKKEHHKV